MRLGAAVAAGWTRLALTCEDWGLPPRDAPDGSGFSFGAVGSDQGEGNMKQVLFAMVAALTLSGCNLPDLDLPAYRSSASAAPSAAAPSAAATAQSPQKPAAFYDAGQAPENTGDYSNYF